jgi:hypothetical protein
MRLAWIETAEENAALLEALGPLTMSGILTRGAVDARIGATDAEEEGEWYWIEGSHFWSGDADGEAVSGAWANWSRLRPNDNGSIGEDCAAFLIDKPDDGLPGEWNDVPCSEDHPFVCELP